METTAEHQNDLSKHGKIWDIISKHLFPKLCNFPHFLKLTYINSQKKNKEDKVGNIYVNSENRKTKE